ncbi:MAG TPA: malectin domain-containing carbohydrate-binding protein, partial [Chitinophagales bacterium]|nr:malectin domain-containing carbohydrate-binding protein [Chitinophagales bacterium]
MGFKPAPPPCAISGCEVYADTIRITTDAVDYTTPDAQGRTWESYLKYNLEGSAYYPASTISNLSSGGPYSTSSDAAIYQHLLYAAYMDWHFAVPDGSYTVVLHFAETVVSQANARVFDILLEGTTVEDNFDVFVAAGNNSNWAITKNYTINVIDGDLQLQLKQEIDNAIISAIEIIPNYCKTTQAVTIADVNVSGCYLNSSGQSKSTISVEVAWEGLYPSDSIQVSAGSLIRWIYPGQYKTPGSVGSIISPQVIAFEVDANGANGTIAAQIVNNSNCSPSTSVYTLPVACPATVCNSGNLGGIVFNDYNADGMQQSGETFGTGGVTVTVFDSNGATFSTTSDINGVWTISNPLTYPVRVEFSNLPAFVGDNGTVNGTNGQTTVQFVDAATCSVDLGVLNGTDYCQTTPDIYIPMYINGDPLAGGASGTQIALKKMPYGTNGYVINSGTTPVATTAQVGSLWGVAYDKKRDKV